MVCELIVEDIGAGLGFWCDLIGFSIAYQRSDQGFAYLERDGAQIMLCQRSGKWETAAANRTSTGRYVCWWKRRAADCMSSLRGKAGFRPVPL